MAEEDVARIPIAPGIKLEDLIQFNGDCIDPLALVIITESLDYALETSARRLKSAGKIFSGVEESAYSGGKGILPMIRAIREALLQAPQCTTEGPKVSPPPSSPEEAIAIKVKGKPDTTETILATLPKEVREKALQEYSKLKAEAKPAKEPSEAPEERKLPGLWGKATFKGKEYDSPQELANELGIRTRGAKNMVVAFERAGFEVKGNGDKVEKGKTGFVVKQVKPIPEKYKLKEEEEAEFEGPGKLALPSKTEKPASGKTVEPTGEEWIEVRKAESGELIGWDLIDPKTGFIVPESRRPATGKKPHTVGFRTEE